MVSSCKALTPNRSVAIASTQGRMKNKDPAVQRSRDPSPRKTHRNSSEDGHGWRQNSRLRSCELGKDVSRVVQCDNRFAQSRLRDQCLKILGEHVRCVRSVWLKIRLLGKKQEMNIEVLWSPWLVIIDLAERHDIIVYIYCPVKIFRRPFLLPQPARLSHAVRAHQGCGLCGLRGLIANAGAASISRWSSICASTNLRSQAMQHPRPQHPVVKYFMTNDSKLHPAPNVGWTPPNLHIQDSSVLDEHESHHEDKLNP